MDTANGTDAARTVVYHLPSGGDTHRPSKKKRGAEAPLEVAILNV
jgi:hypothetical protein